MSTPSSPPPQIVLLIEDNPADARLLRELVSEVPRAGFQMELRQTLEEALQRLAREDVSLVMVDLSLPDSHGLDTFAQVHAASPQVPIIVMSGLDDEDLAIKTVQEGAQDYLVKGHVDSRLLVRCMHYAIERKRVEEALAKERDLLHMLLDNLPDCIYFKDRQSRFLRVSRALAGMFKLTHPREAFMKSDFDFFSREHAEEALDDEHQVMNTGIPILGKIERETHPDGSITWALTSKLPLKDKNGNIVGSFGISRDITQMKLTEEQLKQAHADLKKSHEELKAAQFQLIQAEKMQSIGRLAAGVAHEVKNPLAILRMGIDYLSSNLPAGDENAALILNDMNEAVKRADGIILGLLDFSVPAALDIHPTGLNAVVEESLSLVRHEMASPKIDLVKELASGMPQVWIDRNKIKQVLVNLFTNAIHAMTQGGTLTVRSAARHLRPSEADPNLGSRLADRFRAGDHVAVLEIIDSGPGIAEDKLAQIFDPFFTTKPTGKGTGLGLTVTKKIVELHGGTIEIRNRKEGGAAVTLVLKV